MRMLLITLVIFCSCSDNKQKEIVTQERDKEAVEKEMEKPVKKTETTCYWQILNRDTFVLSLSEKGDAVSGKLSFDNFEKDGSSGNVSGKIENGIVKLWYNFESEGMKSIMEVWFKKEADVLNRATGPMVNKADSAYFSDASTINYTESQVLKMVDCNIIPAKYK